MEIKNPTLREAKLNLFIGIEFVLCFLIVIFTIMQKSSLVSKCFYMSFGVLAVELLIQLVNNKIKKSTIFFLMISIIVISFIFVLINGRNANLTFEYFKKYLIFCSVIIYLYIVVTIKINEKTKNFIFNINIFLGLLYSIFYIIGIRGYLGNYLTFNFSNPNLTGMWLLQTVLYLLLLIFIAKKKTTKFLCLILVVLLTYFIYLAEARNSLIALFSFIILSIYILVKRNIMISKPMVAIIVTFPLIFALLYLKYIETANMNALSFMIAEGKPLTSRIDVWTKAFSQLKQNFISGAYYEISSGIGMSQMHNSHVDILSSYGSITFILVMVYLYKLINLVNKQCKSKAQTICLIAFSAVILMGMGEAALFSGGVGLYILGCSFLLLARYEFPA